MKLDGKCVTIIGGSSGIGLETARQALAEGAFVTIAGRSERRLLQAAERLGDSSQVNTAKGACDRLKTVAADLADEASLRSLFAGEARVDHVFVPAGELCPESADVLTSDRDRLHSILDIRLLGIARVVQHARPKMREGSITLMSGLYAIRPGTASAMAAAAVAAVEGMTRLSPWIWRQCGSTPSLPARSTPRSGMRSARIAKRCCARSQAAGGPHRPAGRDRRRGDLPDDQRFRDRDGVADRRRWCPDLVP